MNNKTINAVVILGVLSLISILFVQLVWVSKTMEMQAKNIAIQEKEDSLNLKEFSEQAHIALTNVLEIITQKTDDNSMLRMSLVRKYLKKKS